MRYAFYETKYSGRDYSVNKNPIAEEHKFRGSITDEIIDLESYDKLRIIPLHRFTLSELRFMKTEELVKYKVMLKRLWEQQNPTA